MSADHSGPRPRPIFLALSALGVVYGDIGTSPLYALKECFSAEHALVVDEANVLGVLSLVFWALMITVSAKYLGYVMRADNKGEGGILALMALASPHTSPERRRVVVLLGLAGAALLYGDGMITPAISVLSAVEGVGLARPELTRYVVPGTIAILIGLFMAQRRGTAGIGAVFGPVMILWFVTLAALGTVGVWQNPGVLAALNPWHGAAFLAHHGKHGLLVLGSVFLVVTGGEALYADMGHFGRKPIRLAWFGLVLPGLLLNYLGQGALLLRDPTAAENPFYRMAPSWALYPLIALSTVATIIASQALISGAFSLTRQASMLGYWPRTRIEHTSAHQIGQIYIPSINWLLMLSTIGLVLGFGSSGALAAAYGIAVTTTMVITTLLAFVVARGLWGWSRLAAGSLTFLLLCIDLAFFSASATKILHGGWFPLVVGAAFLLLMLTWKEGRALLGQRIRDQIVPLLDFYELIRVELPARVPGTAVFMTSNADGAPPALLNNFLHNRVLHAHNVLLTLRTEEVARVAEEERIEVQELEQGFVRVVARYGFMETPDVPALLARAHIPGVVAEHTTYFLGRETLIAAGKFGMSRWRERLFSAMTRNSEPATAFFKIPPDRVLEVGAQIEL